MKTIPTINKIVGEYNPGDLVIVTGAAGSGRTNFLLFDAVSSALNNNNILFCSTEMSTQHVMERVDKCLKSIEGEKVESIYGWGIYSKKKKSKVNILIRQFVSESQFIVRLKNFIKSLEQKGKKPDAVYIDNFEMMVFPSSHNSMCYFEQLDEKITELKTMAQELGVVVFMNMQQNRKHCKEKEDCIVYERLNSKFDFVFHVERNGVYEFSKESIFLINVLQIRNKEKFITIKGSFDFKNMNLKFLEFDYEYDDTLHDLSQQFQGLSFVLSPKNENRSLFLLNLAEMYSKTGKNVFILSKKLVENFNSTRSLLDETGNLNTDEDLMVFEKNIGKKYFTDMFPTEETFFSYMNAKIDNIKNLDYIIVDDIEDYASDDIQKHTKFFEYLRKFVNSKEICLIAGSNSSSRLTANKIELHDFTNTRTKAFIADFVLGLRNYSPGFIEKIIKKRYDIVLRILKNRTGENGTELFGKFDENKLNVKIIKHLVKKIV